MDVTQIEAYAKMGAAMALGFGAIGSALGTGTAGMAGILVVRPQRSKRRRARSLGVAFVLGRWGGSTRPWSTRR